MRQRLSGVFAAFSALLFVAVFAPIPARAAEFVVNSTLDQVDANPGDGICASSAGLCTIRAAVMETNALPNAPAFHSPPDTIRVPPGEYLITIADNVDEDAAATGDLDILDGLRILGTTNNEEVEIGQPIPVYPDIRTNGVFEINPGVHAEMENVAILRGHNWTILNYGDLRLAHVRVEGNVTELFGSSRAIENRGNLFVSGSIFRQNYGHNPGGGGAITNGGAMVLLDTIVAHNGSETHAAVGNDGSALIARCTFEGNYSEIAGAIRNSGVLSILRSSFIGNSSRYRGAGIYNDVTGIVDISDSELRDNRASQSYETTEGVAIYNLGRATVSGTAIIGNGGSADGGPPGVYTDVHCSAIYSSGEIYIINSTIAGNHVTHGAGVCTSGDTTIINSAVVFNTSEGGGSAIQGSNVSIRNSIVAGNTAPSAPDCDGTITSGGHNIFGDGTGCTGFDATDLVGTPEAPIDPLLGPLANNGGPTQTHALLAGSPAIDGVPVEDCVADLDQNPATPDTPLDVDQRGSHRPGGAACDIGPYEVSGSELEAAQCMADLGTAQDEAAQCSTNLGGCQGDLTQCGVDLDACLALPPGLPDQDEDGETDSTDRCAGTPAGVPVDGDGCSRAQFCEAIDTSRLVQMAVCVFSDWRNDQPLSRFPNDCRVVRNGHGRFGFGCTSN